MNFVAVVATGLAAALLWGVVQAQTLDGTKAAGYGCISERWWLQRVDHMSRAKGHADTLRWPQRVVLCDKYWAKGGPIFFYTGGEAEIFLYANATGLLWEHAADLKAMVVFAEVRVHDHWLWLPTAADACVAGSCGLAASLLRRI
jgi:hypothetical protein